MENSLIYRTIHRKQAVFFNAHHLFYIVIQKSLESFSCNGGFLLYQLFV